MSTCPQVETLRRLEAGELSDDEAGQVWQHVERCGLCGQALDRYRRDNLDARVLRAALGGDSSLTTTPKIHASPGSTRPAKVPFWDIPDYERVRLCGEGAYGTVWAVRDRVGMHRALKIIDLQRLREADVQCRESTALEAYCRRVEQHRNLIQIFHVGMQGSLLYYTMELADDDHSRTPVRDEFPPDYRPLTLGRALERGRIRPDTAMEVVIRLLRGLSRLHAVEMAHRDIKPANIVFVGREPKLADIGMITTNTATPSSVGTPDYMPPDGRMDLTGDTFALGKILYELLVGDDRELFPRVHEDVFARSDHWDADKISQVIAKACAPEAEDRYRDAEQMLEAIEGCRRLAFESLFTELEPLSGAAPVPHRSAATPIIIAAIHAIPWILGFVLLIVLAQKLL